MPRPQVIQKGDIFTSKYGDVEVIKYINYRKIKIKFINTDSYKWVTGSNIINQSIKDNYAPNVYGIGFIGVGDFDRRRNKKQYTLWNAMLNRVYGRITREDHISYLNCKVIKRWHNFQNFCEDITKMPNWNSKGFELDKDLRKLGNTIYGPKFCSFVPTSINTAITKTRLSRNLPIGVYFCPKYKKPFYIRNLITNEIMRFNSSSEAEKSYIKYKIKRIRFLADKYKHCIHEEVYTSLYTINKKILYKFCT